jgi:VWFA-related protein
MGNVIIRLKIITIVLVTLAIIFFPINNAFAQTQWDVRVNTISTIETPDHMILKTYFNIYDKGTGRAVTDPELIDAQVTLLNTNLVAAGQLKQPDIPIYIALVLDSSGSMGSSAGILKEAAKLALNNIPNNAFFSVIQFDEEVKLLQDFTENLPAISYAIDQLQVSKRGTCLYDAAFSTVEAMLKAPAGRRAIILFTDGKDENQQGKACSQHSYQELTDKAMKSQVPIHTIGLSAQAGNINALELESMAASTGGFSAIGNKDNLTASFEEIMAGLKAQWMMEATIYPRQGKNNAVLTLNLANNVSLNTDFEIESSVDYPGPPSPVTARLDGLNFKPEDQSYDIQLSLTSPELINYVKISLWDKKGGAKTTEFVFENPAAFNTFNIPSDQLIIGRDYEMRIIATSKDGNIPFAILRSDDGKTATELVHEFTFDPSAVLPQLTIQSVVQQNNDLSVNIATTNFNLVSGYDGWLVDEATNTVLQNSNFNQPALPGGAGSILIPMEANKIADGKYTVVVRALGSSNQVYASQDYAGIVYKATRPSLFQKIGKAMMASPLYFGIIIAIILVVVVFFMVNSMREKSMSGTPVMQGRMGAKRGGKSKKPGSMALADNEPIPNRSSPKPVATQKPPQNSYPTPVQTPVQPTPQASYPLPNAMQQSDRTLVGGPSISPDSTVVANMRGNAVLTLTKAPPGAASVGQRTIVAQYPFTIGRKDAALTINDISVSRLHAQITMDQRNNSFWFEDMNSSNGSFINGVRVNAGQPVQISNGSQLRLGPNVEIKFEII